MSNITWKINQLDREIVDGFVFMAHWQAYAGDKYLMSSACGTVDLDRPEHLIPYSDLTETLVIGWVKSILGPEEVARIETALAQKYADLINPKEESGTPW